MDIKADKLYIIEQLTRLQSTEIIQQIKGILETHSGKIAGYRPDGTPFGQEELINRAKLSNKAIQEGKVSSLEELEKEVKNW